MGQIRSITSRENARLSHVRKVRDGKLRDEIYIEGLRLAVELLRSELSIVEGFVTSGFLEEGRGRSIVDELLRRDVPVGMVPDAIFRSISDTVHPQGIVLLAERPQTGEERVTEAISSSGPALLVFLYRISDPSNVGAIFRTAEAAGVSAIILSDSSANPFSPKSIRAAMGASFRVPVWEGATVDEVTDLARGMGIRAFAADISGGKSYTDLDWRSPVMAVFGSEAHGLPAEVLSGADDVFVIPMKSNVESLNLAVSCGIVLFEAVRQRSSPGRE